MKIFEAMAFTTFNIMVAIVLSSTFFNKAEKSTDVTITALNETHITKFIEHMTDMTSGKGKSFDAYGITTYLMAHIADDSAFASTISYNIPNDSDDNSDVQEEVMDMDKMAFIQHVLESNKSMQDHESAVSIDFIEIAADKRTASAIITTHERGMMPTVTEFGEDTLIPVTGTSFCEQKFSLSDKHVLQITGASCATDMDFSTEY